MSSGSGGSSGGLFVSGPAFGGNGLGTQLFGAKEEDPLPDEDDESAPPPPDSDSDEADAEEIDDPESDAESEESVLAAPANVPSSSSPWLAAPAYKPAYYL